MQNSPEYVSLKANLVDAAEILGDTPDYKFRTGSGDLLRCRSYLFLCHAAFEEYLETLSSSTLREAFSELEAGRVMRSVVISVAYYEQVQASSWGPDEFPETLRGVFRTHASNAVSKHDAMIIGNHGIKTENQRKLFRPLGIEIDDRLLSQKLNSFGVERGGVAHSFSISERRPRKSIENDVNGLVSLLDAFDKAVMSYRNTELFA